VTFTEPAGWPRSADFEILGSVQRLRQLPAAAVRLVRRRSLRWYITTAISWSLAWLALAWLQSHAPTIVSWFGGVMLVVGIVVWMRTYEPEPPYRPPGLDAHASDDPPA
jgi:hypothetical protein